MNEQWEEIRPFFEGMACVKKDGKYGFINEQGDLIIPCEYIAAHDFSEGFAAVEKEFPSGSEFEQVLHNGRIQIFYWDFVDKSGKRLTPLWGWEQVWDFKGGLAKVAEGADGNGLGSNFTGYRYIDTTGEPVTNAWDDIGEFWEGLCWVWNKETDKYGFTDRNRKLVVPCQWDEVQNFRDGMAQVKKDDKWGVVNASGTLVVPCQWDVICIYSDEAVFVGNYDESGYSYCRCGYVDKHGKPVDGSFWDDCWDHDGYLEVEKDGKYGIADDLTGKMITPCKWEWTHFDMDGSVSFGNSEESYLIDDAGNIVAQEPVL